MNKTRKGNDILFTFCCPVCGGELRREEKSLRCEKNHCFDIAKQNYVNLLMSNKSSAKRHGDDALMVKARTEFLEAGWYECLRDALGDLAVRHASDGGMLLDAGCGEGYYTSYVLKTLREAGKSFAGAGIDISKTALIAAAKRDRELSFAVAGVNRLPAGDGSCSLLMNVFAPNDDREFWRVLRPGGVLLKAVPDERHLFGLKAAVYEKPYLNPAPSYSPEGFELLERADISREITVRPTEQIMDLFMMTPYYYKTGAEDQKKLASLPELRTEIAFTVFALRKL